MTTTNENPLPQPDPAAAWQDGRLLRAVLDGTTDSVFVKDRAGRYRMINAAGAGYLGRSAAEVVGRTDADLLPADMAHAIMEHDRVVVESGAARSFEAKLPVAGKARVFLSTKTPYRDARGAVVGLIGISRDITERKQAETALRESEDRLARILESAMDAIVTIDEQREVRLFNAAAEDMFRCPAKDAFGRSFDRFTTKNLRDMLARCQQAFEKNHIKKRYVWIPGGLAALRADGAEFPIEATISQVQVAEQRLLTIILRDVNERKQAQDELRRLQMANLYWQEQAQAHLAADDLVGESPTIRNVLHAIDQVAATDSTVLIEGETGTGKELVARAIHNHSARKKAILVNVNCAALPAGLVESELFGHEKGAFTGALARKIGRFEMANGGTLLLDEVGDLPIELQAKLLRVLQEGEFERVGSGETHKVDVRVIAATNRDLQRAIEEHRFRADLFYRLNVFPIRIPPLRERAADIPLLVPHFVLVFARRMGKRIESIPPATMQALQNYSWPGNVRELQNVIERAVIVSPGPVLELGEWPLPHAPTLPNGSSPDAPPGVASDSLTLEEMERRHILKVLESTNWRVSGPRGAAGILGLRPTTLESRLKKLGIARKT